MAGGVDVKSDDELNAAGFAPKEKVSNDPRAWDLALTSYTEGTLCINCGKMRENGSGRCNRCWSVEAKTIRREIDNLACAMGISFSETIRVLVAIGLQVVSDLPGTQRSSLRRYAEGQISILNPPDLPFWNFNSPPLPSSKLVGPLIRERRERAGMSRAALAARTNLSETTIQKLEDGERLPVRGTALALCAVSELDLNTLDMIPPSPLGAYLARELIPHFENTEKVESTLKKRLQEQTEELRRREERLNETVRDLNETKRKLAETEALYRKENLAPFVRKSRPKGWVYFIANESSGAIKIGYSSDPEKRLSDLQVASPAKLRLIGRIPGGAELERQLHQKFWSLRLNGEWFKYEDELVRYIESIQSDTASAA